MTGARQKQRVSWEVPRLCLESVETIIGRRSMGLLIDDSMHDENGLSLKLDEKYSYLCEIKSK